MSSGWYAVRRGITKHPIFHKKPERLAVWMWLLDNACWKPTEYDIKGKTITVQRGQICASERYISDECGVGYQVVRTLFKRLKTEQMINAEVMHGKNVITLCNYEKYQEPTKPNNAAPNATLTQDQRTKEQGNKTLPTEGPSASPVPDMMKVMFDGGVSLLGQAGIPEGKARGILGRWKKGHGAPKVIEAIASAQRNGAIEPVAYITKVLKDDKAGSAQVKADGSVNLMGTYIPKKNFRPVEAAPC